MQEYIIVTGIILKAMPVGEYDRRVTILTNSRGKIGAFARGARKPTSRFAASTGIFSFGTFKLFEGRDSYTLAEADISNYFEEFRTDIEGMAYGSYFAEIADYYCRENNDERDMMKLFYQSLKALLQPVLPRTLVRSTYELKALAVNGEYPGVPSDRPVSDAVRAALRYIGECPAEKTFGFLLEEDYPEELAKIARDYREKYMEHHFKSLEILEGLC